MTNLTTATLAEWFQPTSASVLSAEDVSELEGAIAAVHAALTPVRRIDLVELACVGDRPVESDWLIEAARANRPAIPMTGNAELVARLAAASVAAGLSPRSEHTVPLALLVQSAAFLGLEPKFPELAEWATVSLQDAATAARQRPRSWSGIGGTVKADLDGPTETEPNDAGVTTEIDVHANAITRVADAVDDLATRLESHLKSIDEEYDTLWWSYTARSSTSGEPWSAVEPLARRVVLVSNELGGHLQRVPSPPIVRGLMAAALGDDAETLVGVADVATAAATEGCFPETTRESRLLPIESCVYEIRRLDDSAGDVWGASIERALHIDATRRVSALEAACQVRREVEIGSFLG